MDIADLTPPTLGISWPPILNLRPRSFNTSTYSWIMHLSYFILNFFLLGLGANMVSAINCSNSGVRTVPTSSSLLPLSFRSSRYFPPKALADRTVLCRAERHIAEKHVQGVVATSIATIHMYIFSSLSNATWQTADRVSRTRVPCNFELGLTYWGVSARKMSRSRWANAFASATMARSESVLLFIWNICEIGYDSSSGWCTRLVGLQQNKQGRKNITLGENSKESNLIEIEVPAPQNYGIQQLKYRESTLHQDLHNDK